MFVDIVDTLIQFVNERILFLISAVCHAIAKMFCSKRSFMAYSASGACILDVRKPASI